MNLQFLFRLKKILEFWKPLANVLAPLACIMAAWQEMKMTGEHQVAGESPKQEKLQRDGKLELRKLYYNGAKIK